MLSLNYGDSISIKGDNESVVLNIRDAEFCFKATDVLGSKVYHLVSVNGSAAPIKVKAYHDMDKEIKACLDAFLSAERTLKEGIQDDQKYYIVKCSMFNGVFYKEDVVQASGEEEAISKFCGANSIPLDLFSEGNIYGAKIYACIAEDECCNENRWLG